MFLPLPTPAEMTAWDKRTIDDIGLPGMTLMESAAREAISVLLEEFGPVDGAEIYCFAGSGNNGGDAFAMARYLIDMGADVTVFHTRPKKQYRGEARSNLLLAQKVGVPLKHLATTNMDSLPQPDVVIDGLLGTGFQGELRADYMDLVQSMNAFGDRAFVLSIDIPSGLNGLTGRPQPEAVHADATATFQAAKLGMVMPEASHYTGMIHVCPIGIPMQVQEDIQVSHHMITGEAMNHIPVPTKQMHKGTAGHVLIIGGSPGLTGAPHLAALGALRGGAGLATIACPGGLMDSVKAGSPDIMCIPLGDGTEWTPELLNIIQPELTRFDAVVIGPGLGRSAKTVDFLKAFVAMCPPRTVLDADALFGLSLEPKLVKDLPHSTVLTPHPGEMARLSQVDTSEIQADRLDATRIFVANTNTTLVLKGAGTLVVDKETTCISPFSEPNLAVGGSGDILAGLIGTLMAQGLTPKRAACLGVYWHGLAGRMLSEDFPERGNLAHEIADMLPMAAKEFAQC